MGQLAVVPVLTGCIPRSHIKEVLSKESTELYCALQLPKAAKFRLLSGAALWCIDETSREQHHMHTPGGPLNCLKEARRSQHSRACNVHRTTAGMSVPRSQIGTPRCTYTGVQCSSGSNFLLVGRFVPYVCSCWQQEVKVIQVIRLVGWLKRVINSLSLSLLISHFFLDRRTTCRFSVSSLVVLISLIPETNLLGL